MADDSACNATQVPALALAVTADLTGHAAASLEQNSGWTESRALTACSCRRWVMRTLRGQSGRVKMTWTTALAWELATQLLRVRALSMQPESLMTMAQPIAEALHALAYKWQGVVILVRYAKPPAAVQKAPEAHATRAGRGSVLSTAKLASKQAEVRHAPLPSLPRSERCEQLPAEAAS